MNKAIHNKINYRHFLSLRDGQGSGVKRIYTRSESIYGKVMVTHAVRCCFADYSELHHQGLALGVAYFYSVRQRQNAKACGTARKMAALGLQEPEAPVSTYRPESCPIEAQERRAFEFWSGLGY